MFKWFKDIKEILNQDPEEWLAYLCGQEFEQFNSIMDADRKYPGLFLQLTKFSYTIMRAWKPFHKVDKEKVDYYIFSSAINQVASTEALVYNLIDNNESIKCLALRHVFKNTENTSHYSTLSLTTSDILKTLLLVVLQCPSLYYRQRRNNPDSIKFYLTEFLWVYGFLVYFHKTLKNHEPKFVITSNNLNPSNRSLLSVANKLGIKTVYLQHGLIVKNSPPLNVNYAFLDGQYSLDIYRQSHLDSDNNSEKYIVPSIYLTGVQKPIYKSSGHNITIGIAINPLDKIQDILKFIQHLTGLNHNIIVRWHPIQSKKDIDKIFLELRLYQNITLSNPLQEPVNVFLSNISYLVAGNSSIHLEAALARITPIYYEFTKPENPDWYQFIKNGVCLHAKTVSDISAIVNKSKQLLTIPEDSIRYYSATYNTAWEGHEGHLIARSIKNLADKKPLSIPVHHL